MWQLITNHSRDTCFNTITDTTSYRPCKILCLLGPCYHNFMDITYQRTRPACSKTKDAILAPSFLSRIAEMTYGREALTGTTDRSAHRFCSGSTTQGGSTAQSRSVTKRYSMVH